MLYGRKIQNDPPPRVLLNFLKKFSLTKKTEILRLREKMLASDLLDINSVTLCTQDGRFATGSSMTIGLYLEKIGLELSEPIIDR